MKVRRILLVSTNVALFAAFGFLWSNPKPFDHDDVMSRKDILISSLPPFPEPLQGTFDRALFRANSRSDTDDEAQRDAGSESVIRLLGVILSDDRKVAMVEQSGALRRVEEGADLEGWQVMTIEARAIRLANTERQIEIPLDVPANP